MKTPYLLNKEIYAFFHALDFDGVFAYLAKLIRDHGFGEDIITTIKLDLLSRKSNRSILRAINTLQAQNTFSSEIETKHSSILTLKAYR